MLVPPSASGGLSTFPPEVIEQIGFFTATSSFLGPPSYLPSLLSTNRWINLCLSFEHNPYLYARIFAAKFDTAAITRRDLPLKEHIPLAAEFKRRCICLKRLRSREDATRSAPGEISSLTHNMWTAYFMLLEDDGCNRRQLMEYADLRSWLVNYWFHENGASGAVQHIRNPEWPTLTTIKILAMWMLWYTMDLDTLPSSYLPLALKIFRVYSLSASRYRLTNNLRLVPFDSPPSSQTPVDCPRGQKLVLPPIAPAALTLYFATIAKVERSLSFSTTSIVPMGWSPSMPISLPSSFAPDSRESDTIWNRMKPATPGFDVRTCFVPGSFEGIWEGMFEYVEFDAYARIIGGAGPSIIHEGITAHHKQTWRLHEFHLLETDGTQQPPVEGDPLHSYLPIGTHIKVAANGKEMEVKPPGMEGHLNYVRPKEGREGKVVDIIISGEGHSAWGEFTLCGRVRPRDGLITLMKLYNDDHRGSWLYRGYLIGTQPGVYIGRWRDTLTTVEVAGYEGPFVMNRRA